MILPLLISLALSFEPKPDPVEVGTSECTPVSIRAGYPIPESLMLMGVVGCDGEVVPRSEIATLYAIEAWADGMQDEYRLDIAALDLEIEWLKKQNATEMLPWGKRPEIQRWMGRLDVIIPVAVALITFGVVAGVE